MSYALRLGIVIALFLIAVLIIFSFPPIAQDPHYHNFADKRAWWGIQNFFDVGSNVLYIIVGIGGLLALNKCKDNPHQFSRKLETLPFIIAFVGIAFVGVGSAYYHLNPTNCTLVWDRLPMTIGFMAIVSLIISERIDFKGGLYLLPILLVAGIGSVWYWHLTESVGHGDLRPYVLVQFFPMIVLPLIFVLFKPSHTGTTYFVGILVWYLLAKICEYFDSQLFHLTNESVSGHTLKHIAAAVATYGLVRYVRQRTILNH